jgi:hypothetical protein
LKLVFPMLLLACLSGTCCGAQESGPPPLVPSTQAPAPAATPPAAPATPATSFQISGAVRSGKTPLPGVSVTATNTLTGKKFVLVTAGDGTFFFTGLPRGRYVVKVQFMGFADFTQEVVLNPENPAGKVDPELLLASRQQEQTSRANAAMASAGRGFQSLAVDSALSSLAGGGLPSSGPANSSDIASLPMNGAGADTSTESVSINGAQGRTQDFGGGSEEDLQDRIQEFRERAQREGLLGGNGQAGPGGAQGGGPGGDPELSAAAP